MARLERDYQPKVIAKIERRLPGVYVFKGDTRFKQGTPDLFILYKDRWALLEVKKSQSESKRPNQEFYINELNDMSFASFIYPENEEEVLNAIQRALQD